MGRITKPISDIPSYNKTHCIEKNIKIEEINRLASIYIQYVIFWANIYTLLYFMNNYIHDNGFYLSAYFTISFLICSTRDNKFSFFIHD